MRDNGSVWCLHRERSGELFVLRSRSNDLPVRRLGPGGMDHSVNMDRATGV